MDELRILVISQELPQFPGKGSAVRLLHLSRLLSADFSLTLLCLSQPKTKPPPLPWFEQVEFLPFEPERDSFTGATLGNLPGREMFMELRKRVIARPAEAHFFTPPYLLRLERAISTLERRSRAQFYGFLVETDVLAAAIRAIPTHGLAVLDCHRVSSFAYQAEADSCGRGALCRKFQREAKKFRAYERKWWPKFDIVALTSAEDLEAAERLNLIEPDRLALVPNGVDVEFFTFKPEERNRNQLLFVADFSTPSNVEAATTLLVEVLPEIERLGRSIKLTIIGRNAPKSLLDILNRTQNAELIENVQDIRTYYQKAFAFIAPYGSGGGARLTVLEAMASGLPVITSTFGLHGLDVSDGEELLVADSAGAFAVALDRLYNHPDLYRTLQYNARKYVEINHPWDKVASLMAEIFLRQHTLYARNA